MWERHTPRATRWVVALGLIGLCAACEAGGDEVAGEGAEADATPSDSELEQLVGVWERKQGQMDVRLELRGDGSYTQQTETTGLGGSLTDGVWSAAGGRLALQTTARRLESDFVVTDSVLTRAQVYRRQSLGDGWEGTWRSESTDTRLESDGSEALVSVQHDTLRLFDGGEAEFSTETLNAAGQIVSTAPFVDKRPGTWAVNDSGAVTLTFPSTGDIRTFERHQDRIYDRSALYVHTRAAGP